MAESDQPRQESAVGTEQQLANLAAQLGFVEGEELLAARTQIAEKIAAGEAEEAIQAYQDEAIKLVESLEGRAYTAGQIGLVVSMASIRRSARQPDRFVEELGNAFTMADNQGFEAEALILKDMLEKERLEQVTEELIAAADDYLDEDDIAMLREGSFGEEGNRNYVVGRLVDQGVDPVAFLLEKGIFE